MPDIIDERVSIRAYTDEEVSEADIRSLLQAAMAAPSAGNQQPWEFVVCRDAGLRATLSEVTPYAKPAAKAPVVIALLMRQDVWFPPMAVQDVSAACENILLRTTSLGLGAVWLGIYPLEDRVEAVARALEVDSGALTPFALVCVGHPAKHPAPTGPTRYDEARVQWR